MTAGARGISGSDGALHASVQLVDAADVPVGPARLVEDLDGGVHVDVHVPGTAPGRHGIHVLAAGEASLDLPGSQW